MWRCHTINRIWNFKYCVSCSLFAILFVIFVSVSNSITFAWKHLIYLCYVRGYLHFTCERLDVFWTIILMKKFNPTEHVIRNDLFATRMCRLLLMEWENMKASMFYVFHSYLYLYIFTTNSYPHYGVRRTSYGEYNAIASDMINLKRTKRYLSSKSYFRLKRASIHNKRTLSYTMSTATNKKVRKSNFILASHAQQETHNQKKAEQSTLTDVCFWMLLWHIKNCKWKITTRLPNLRYEI